MANKQLKLEDMNAAEYRRHLMQQSYELRQTAVKATGDKQATVLHASDAAKAKATEVMEAPLVPLADERRVTPNEIGNITDGAGVAPVVNNASTAATNPPAVKVAGASADPTKK